VKVLVIGSGGREHALVWKLKQSRKVDKIFCAPGNGGISRFARCVNIKVTSTKALTDFAARNRVHLTVVGPEVPLAKGIADGFRRRKLKVFGPGRKGARLESRKIFSKEFMRKYHIPTAPFKVFEVSAEAKGFCRSIEFPAVIKTDGLAAGKGAVVVHDIKEAVKTIDEMMENKVFGSAGKRIIIESFISGQEVSVMAFIDGKTILPLLPSQDHKQIHEGDRGPNTGGMGAYCPTDFVTPEIMNQIRELVLIPTLNGLRKEDIDYRGLIYAGLMLTPAGPKVLEYNCRFGDPETQAVLPLLKTDLFEVMLATSNRKLSSFGKLTWKNESAACVVMASRGYPGKYKTGLKISGLSNKPDNSCLVFHAGTVTKGDQVRTAGGRVMGITGVDRNLRAALNRAYQGVNKIRYEGATFRKDIGFRVLGNRNKGDKE